MKDEIALDNQYNVNRYKNGNAPIVVAVTNALKNTSSSIREIVVEIKRTH